VSTHQHIAQRATQVPVRQLCQVLRLAPAAYYAWQRHRQSPTAEPAWQVAVREAFVYHSQRYGTRRLRAEVQAQGHAVGHWCIRRVLKTHGLRAQQPRSFVPRTTDSDPTARAAPNRLQGQPASTAPNRVWVGDITYLPRQGGGWLYLAVWLDRCSRKIVGWDVRDTMLEDLVSEALRRALVVRRPAAGLVVHSDQGSQYTATRFKALGAK
jgi:putative transposase